MKRLFIIGLCVVAALAAPRPDDDDDDDDNGPQHFRRFHNEQPQEFDDDDDQQQQQNRRRLQSLSLKLIDDSDDDNKREVRIKGLDDDIDDDDDLLRNKNLDVLARELDNLTSKYKGRGVLKIAYNPPVVRNVPGARVHNLGNLNFKYYTPNDVGNRWQSHRDLVPIPVPEVKSDIVPLKKNSRFQSVKAKPTVNSKKLNNGYLLLGDLRDGDDDDDDDEKK